MNHLLTFPSKPNLAPCPSILTGFPVLAGFHEGLRLFENEELRKLKKVTKIFLNLRPPKLQQELQPGIWFAALQNKSILSNRLLSVL